MSEAIDEIRKRALTIWEASRKREEAQGGNDEETRFACFEICNLCDELKRMTAPGIQRRWGDAIEVLAVIASPERR